MNEPEPNTVTPEKSSLRACPYCGGTEIDFARREVSWKYNERLRTRIVAVCLECGAAGPAFGNMSVIGERTAATYWNRRAAAWVAVDEVAPPENVKVRCLTEKHGEADGVRKGRCIHVGLPESWKPSVTHWQPLAGH